MRINNTKYRYYMPNAIGGYATFEVKDNRFDCADANTAKCQMLER